MKLIKTMSFGFLVLFVVSQANIAEACGMKKAGASSDAEAVVDADA